MVSILSIWNTMMGTSVLAMPWAIDQAGFGLGVAIVILMCLVCMYTCQLVLRYGEGGTLNGEPVEFSDVVRIYLGERWYVVANMFSIFTLMGSCFVYWVLMSSFLSSIVTFIMEYHSGSDTTDTNDDGMQTYSTEYWNDKLIPVYLVVLLFPLLNLKSISFFTKFNSLGAFSIIYLLFFILYTTFSGEKYKNSPFGGYHMQGAKYHVHMVELSAFSLVGVLTLSYFIHNGCLSILRNARNPRNNARDLSIAYILVCGTYLIVGICLYVSFNGDKSKIKSNFLKNFTLDADNYVFAFVAQCFLFVQFVTVFPLLMYLIRFQAMTMLFKSAWPSLWHVLALNALLVALAVFIAIFFPNIGPLLRYTGAICGLIYVFAMPLLVDRENLKRKGVYGWADSLRVWGLIALGVLNVIAQFVPQSLMDKI